MSVDGFAARRIHYELLSEQLSLSDAGTSQRLRRARMGAEHLVRGGGIMVMILSASSFSASTSSSLGRAITVIAADTLLVLLTLYAYFEPPLSLAGNGRRAKSSTVDRVQTVLAGIAMGWCAAILSTVALVVSTGHNVSQGAGIVYYLGVGGLSLVVYRLVSRESRKWLLKEMESF